MAARATLDDDIQACVVELNLDRRDLATAQDVVAAEIPVGIFSPRECIAVLQTLLFEAGFHFDNLVPVWFSTRASKIAADLVRSLVGDLQRLLAAELTEWRTLCVGATLKVNPALEREADVEDTPFMDYHAEDQDGEFLMNDYEVNLLGRSYVLRLRMTGLRPARSTTSSSVGEPPSKRQQHRPPRPEDPLASLPSELSSTATSDQEDLSTVPISDPVPSLVGTTDGAARGTTSESLVSRNSSPGSSSTSFETGGGAHMPLAAYGPMVMSARTSGSGMPGGGDLGYYLTSKAITSERRILPDQEDVIMADPEVAVNTKPGGALESRRRRSDRVSNRRHSSSKSESESGRSRHRRSSRSRRSSSKKFSRKRSSSRRSSYLGRSHRSGRSGWSVSTGVAEAAVSALREAQQVREELAKLTEQLAAQKLTSTPEVDVQHALAEAEVRAREAELRAQEAERHLAGVSIEDTRGIAQREDIAAAIQAACLQAANAERERVEAAAIQLLQQQQTEVDARREAEQAAWLQQAQKNLDEYRAAFERRLEDERVTARNMQRHQAEKIRNLQATSTQVQVERATSSPNSATQVKSERSDPERATETSGVIMGGGTDDRTQTEPKNTAERLLAQIRAALPDALVTQRAGSVPAPRKADTNAATLKTNAPQRNRTEVPKADTKKGVRSERQPVPKKPDRKLTPPKKSQRSPSGHSSSSLSSSSSSSSSSSDSSSSDSEDSLDEDFSTGVDPLDATKLAGLS
ncbi:hypothetical protein PF005_g27544 [Phytophthora fragariae]|uniref:Uncharacterized protein n=1 Tax=Phytophthora fragariae TaxID=53985 RepID=A0A6A3DQ86_9STRA|nr:hypothetical protein PF003_g7403 [Phytophthora fragariae]KAE8924254.1 hypothetical protein PF009_g25512 [Phytophthora fragariae]KAE9073202.1 hypothetical protein PF007_g25888 [Phytophthora fragariae]KAE9097601.1 hypothetical protein PF006_g23546 [Phytophthora fragariae]KAE9170469.1 hypothetical protein PF005_g27544 [Phytophthora fragariae]